jgi:polyisoprenoid-binding protein YceI
MKSLAALSATLLLAGATGIAYAAPETYVIDNAHTFPRFSYSHMGLSKQLSRFDKTTGTVTLDPVARTGAVDVTIDMNSVDTGYEVFNGHLKGADFLDTAQFPVATFKSTHVTFEGATPVRVDGDLTIKGITHPVTLTVSSFFNGPHPMMKKPAIGANASTVIHRSDFNAGKYAPAVGDGVALDISLEAVRN